MEPTQERREAAERGWEHRREHEGKVSFPCPDCGAEVSSDDDKCSNCAFPVSAYVVKKRLAEVEQREAGERKAKEQEEAKKRHRGLLGGVI
jgi:hypothetical protein